jgi:hypothetical protein
MTTTPPPAMPPMPAQAPKPATKRRTGWIIVAGIAAVLVVVTAVVWMNGDSYQDTVANCKEALAAQTAAGGSGKPDACDGVKEDDYDALVIGNVLDNMPKKDKDMLDYYDNGTIDGSIG